MSVITITKDNYESIINSDKPVLIDFWAPWCGPCRTVGPVIDEIATENDNIVVGKINVDEESELAGKFSVQSIPTLIVIKDKKEANRAVGAMPKANILNLI